MRGFAVVEVAKIQRRLVDNVQIYGYSKKITREPSIRSFRLPQSRCIKKMVVSTGFSWISARARFTKRDYRSASGTTRVAKRIEADTESETEK